MKLQRFQTFKVLDENKKLFEHSKLFEHMMFSKCETCFVQLNLKDNDHCWFWWFEWMTTDKNWDGVNLQFEFCQNLAFFQTHVMSQKKSRNLDKDYPKEVAFGFY